MYNKIDIMDATAEQNELLKRSGDQVESVRRPAQEMLARAFTEPLRNGIMSGDIVSNIYDKTRFAPTQRIEYSLDFVSPGTEGEYTAYCIPKQGRIPEHSVEGDYVTLTTYEIGNSIDWLLRYARDARWDIVSRALQVMEKGFVKKMNDDGWHALLMAGYDRNILVYDSAAAAGQFTTRLITLMQNTMIRNGGGNSASGDRGELTDIYLSPEGLSNVRHWGLDIVDDMTRNRIFNSSEGLRDIFGVNLHSIDELGVGREYQTYLTSTLGGSLQASDTELVVGLDLKNRDSFMMPLVEDIRVFVDDNLHRQRRAGYYAWGEMGFGVLDGRRVLFGSY